MTKTEEVGTTNEQDADRLDELRGVLHRALMAQGASETEAEATVLEFEGLTIGRINNETFVQAMYRNPYGVLRPVSSTAWIKGMCRMVFDLCGVAADKKTKAAELRAEVKSGE